MTLLWWKEIHFFHLSFLNLNLSVNMSDLLCCFFATSWESCFAGKYEPGNPKKPLHQCNFYGSVEAGNKMKEMLSLGSSRPWREAMEKMTGQRKMSTKAIREYFEPLEAWLKNENKRSGVTVGWGETDVDLMCEQTVSRSSNVKERPGEWKRDFNNISFLILPRIPGNKILIPPTRMNIHPSISSQHAFNSQVATLQVDHSHSQQEVFLWWFLSSNCSWLELSTIRLCWT